MSKEKHETIEEIVSEMREGVVADGWMEQTLREFADRIEAAWKREREACAEVAQICGEIGEAIGRRSSGNAAKMREALINAYYAMFKFIKTPYAECDDMAFALDEAKAALDEPPRNCDRPECATSKSAQEVWRQEDGGKTAYYEWILATSTAKGESK